MFPNVTDAQSSSPQLSPGAQGTQTPTVDPSAIRRSRANDGLTQLVIVALLTAVAFGAGWFSNAYVNQDRYISNNNELLIHQAWNDINTQFAVTGAINQKQMAYAAISAMTTSLGDTGHSRFETPEEYAAENSQLNNGPSIGIGISLGGGGSTPPVIEVVYPGSAAAKGGLRPGDQILIIAGQSTSGQNLNQVSAEIGANGTHPFKMGLYRPSTKTNYTVTLTRGPFTVPTAETFYIPGTTLVDIQLVQFAADADAQMRAAIKDALSKHVTGIILDLRGDPGGLLDQAVSVASEFIPYSSSNVKNVLVVKTRSGEQDYQQQPGGLATTIPLVILVDNGTASAAEITTGAIAQDRAGVHVVGQTTFGTGTVLYPLPLADGSVLLLGVGEFFLPDGTTIYHKGFVPDQQVKLPGTATALTPLVAQETQLTAAQVAHSGDTQLLTAISDLGGSLTGK
ncbi:MAG TPA: S41 family peptidase [Ktedonobacterales bacterium]|nr:S41 family peptidase [Ktedonobacterales bacterium]